MTRKLKSKRCIFSTPEHEHDASRSVILITSSLGQRTRVQTSTSALPICDGCLLSASFKLSGTMETMTASREGSGIEALRVSKAPYVSDKTMKAARQIVNRDAARKRWANRK